jgi:Domain of unknown function (DUF4386)
VRVAGALILVVAPLGFNLFFLLLARWFEYPEILRKPTPYILARFRAGGARLILAWWGFMLSGVVLLPGVILLAQAMAVDRLAILPVTIAFGVLAALVQILGLLRWVYLVPYLARTHDDPEATEVTRQAAGVVFQAFHRSLGVGVGEHLGYLFTGVWTVLVGVGMLQGSLFPGWVGWVGIVLGSGQIVGSAEFLGPNEERGWALAGALIPVVYLMWSAWLITTGVFLLLA